MELAKRKSPRATWLDYNEGEYFVTVCTQGHKHFFGNIHQGKMLLSEIGKHLVACIENTPHHQPHIRIVQYVVMPNHVHMIVVLTEGKSSLNQIIGQFKSGVSRKIHEINSEICVCQRSFHDHIIRKQKEYEKIWLYIEANPMNWEKDCFYIDPNIGTV